MVEAPAPPRAHLPNGDPTRGATLTIRDVSHHFALQGQHLPVLDRISFRVGYGEFVAILGPSGCGKSTLLRLVAGLDFPSTGYLLTEGQPIEGPDPSRVVVFQDPTLYPWRTVWRNVALGLEARGSCAPTVNGSKRPYGWSGSRVSPTLIRTSFPAACRSARLWRAHWSTIHGSLFSTSHWASSTR